jgi:hypothetical protein
MKRRRLFRRFPARRWTRNPEHIVDSAVEARDFAKKHHSVKASIVPIFNDHGPPMHDCARCEVVWPQRDSRISPNQPAVCNQTARPRTNCLMLARTGC